MGTNLLLEGVEVKRIATNALAGVGVAAIVGGAAVVVVVRMAKKKEWSC